MITPDMADFVQAIAKARGTSTYQYGAGAIGIIDFRNFVETLMLSSPSDDVSEACARVLADFDRAVIALQDTQALEGFVHGLGIQFPKRESMLPGYYPEYAFGSDGWIEFMKLFWEMQGPGKNA